MILDDYLNNYEQGLREHLLRMLTSMGLQDGKLLETPDITELWDQLVQEYVTDAVPEIAKYPMVSLGWAMYLGMAVARFWDEDWEKAKAEPNLYVYLRDRRGFDYMDEYIREQVLRLEGTDFDQAERTVQACAQQVLTQIRKEQIEPQSPTAFHVYVRSIKTLYICGAAIELRQLGYKLEKL